MGASILPALDAATVEIFALAEARALATIPLNEVQASSEAPPGCPPDEERRIRSWLNVNRSVLNATPSASGDDLELAIIGVVGSWWDGISARAVRDVLDRNKSAKKIRVLIDSPGGDYFDGVAIMNLLKRHGATVTTEVIGEASSAGSVIAMGGDRIEMHAGTMMMIHRAWTMAVGNGDDLRNIAESLDKIDSGLVSVYAARTGKKTDAVRALVDATTWMSPQDAVAGGFADAELPALPKKTDAKQSATVGAIPSAAAAGVPARAAATRTTPAPENPEPSQPSTAPRGQENSTMTFPKNIITALALSDDADDAAVVAAVNRLKTSAKIGTEIEQLLGATGNAAIGAVRALQTTQEAHATLGGEVSKLKVVNARRDFDAALAKGFDPKDRKLTPAMAKRYRDKFDTALKVDDPSDAAAVTAAADKAAEVVEDLVGFIAVAPRIATGVAPQGGSGGGDQGVGGPMTFNGKTFEAMNGVERKSLKDENPDLYNEMRNDAVARKAI